MLRLAQILCTVVRDVEETDQDLAELLERVGLGEDRAVGEARRDALGANPVWKVNGMSRRRRTSAMGKETSSFSWTSRSAKSKSPVRALLNPSCRFDAVTTCFTPRSRR